MAQSSRPRPDQATRDAVTERTSARARENWPGTEILVRHSGALCYVAVLERAEARRWRLFSRAASEPEPFPVLRRRYQGSADRHDNVATDNAVRGERDGLMRHIAFGSLAWQLSGGTPIDGGGEGAKTSVIPAAPASDRSAQYVVGWPRSASAGSPRASDRTALHMTVMGWCSATGCIQPGRVSTRTYALDMKMTG